MGEKLGQEPAFPSEYTTGMSKRFYAACAAMNGILASNDTQDYFNPIYVARKSFEYADELLKQENQTEQ